MSVPHPGGDPNANLYAQLKRDVLDRVPQIAAVEYVPDDIEARRLRATFDPTRLDAPSDSAEHFGLVHARERLELVGGELSVDTAPGQGTRVRVQVPLRLP